MSFNWVDIPQSEIRIPHLEGSMLHALCSMLFLQSLRLRPRSVEGDTVTVLTLCSMLFAPCSMR